MGMTWTWSHWSKQTERKRKILRERFGLEDKQKREKQEGNGGEKTVKDHCQEEINNINILITQCAG